MARDKQDMVHAAIDVGTTSIKAVLFDQAGRERVVARASVGVDRPQPGWAEQDMRAVWQEVIGLLSELAQAAGPSLAGLAITAQGDGCWLSDAEGVPVRPAILWNDGRAGPRVASWLADGTLGRMLDIGHFTGFAGIPAAILPWLAEMEPTALTRARTVFTCGSWIYRRLTGQTLIDPSDAAVPFMSATRQAYDDTLLDLSGVKHIAALLPPIAQAGRPVYGLLPHVSATTGLPVDLPVVLAPYDVPAAALGAGCVEPGDMLMVLGTTFLTGSVVSGGTPPSLAAPTCHWVGPDRLCGFFRRWWVWRRWPGRHGYWDLLMWKRRSPLHWRLKRAALCSCHICRLPVSALPLSIRS